MRDRDPLLTVGEIGPRVGLEKDTVYVMSSRGALPPPDELKNKDAKRPTKLWKTSTIDEWDKTRLDTPAPRHGDTR